ADSLKAFSDAERSCVTRAAEHFDSDFYFSPEEVRKNVIAKALREIAKSLQRAHSCKTFCFSLAEVFKNRIHKWIYKAALYDDLAKTNRDKERSDQPALSCILSCNRLAEKYQVYLEQLEALKADWDQAL